jgi:2,4-dienoyl-CoA reductase-like NADH-dependent reductase (Old Yellow Enzyme family)
LDSWGGDIRARTRFAVETVRAVRNAIGPTVPIMFRWSQWKQQDYDARLADNPVELEAMLTPLAEAGVDVFDVSARRFDLPAFEGSETTLAGWTKQVTGLPAVAVGGVGLMKDLYGTFKAGGSEVANNLHKVREKLDTGEFDLIGVGRALLADPNWPKKVARGDPLLPLEPIHLAAFSDNKYELI